MRLYVQYHGFFSNDLAWHLGLYNAATLDQRDKPRDWYQAPSYTYLIQHPTAGWILFDCGSHRDRTTGRMPEEAELFPWEVAPSEHYLASLERLGLAPKDADILALSHLHNDHTGNLDLFSRTKAGQGVLVQRAELQHALFVTHLSDTLYSDSYYRPDFAGVAGIRFRPVEGDVEIADGVSLIHLPGHTPGSQALLVNLPKTGAVILTGDAVYQSRNYGPPAIPPAIMDSKREWLQSIEKLRVLERRHGARLFFSHDWDQCQSLRLAPEYYE